MNTIKEMKRLTVDVVNAITLLFLMFAAELLSLGIKVMVNIPKIGINNNDISNIYRYLMYNEFSSFILTYA